MRQHMLSAGMICLTSNGDNPGIDSRTRFSRPTDGRRRCSRPFDTVATVPRTLCRHGIGPRFSLTSQSASQPTTLSVRISTGVELPIVVVDFVESPEESCQT